jgi:two-component system, OmpR family, sensor histidine kinase KdpD
MLMALRERGEEEKEDPVKIADRDCSHSTFRCSCCPRSRAADYDGPMTRPEPRSTAMLRGLAASVGSVVLATFAAWTLLGRQHLADVVMVYLLGTVLVAMRFGYGPSLGAAALSVLCFNFFFIPPYYTFAVADPRHLVTFGVMFLVAAVISRLTQRVRHQADEVATEQLRNALLSSVSHDLRTPLAVVTGAASALLEEGVPTSEKHELTRTILEEAERLNRLVQNLLDMTRLEAGLRVRREWHAVEEVIGSALARVEPQLGTREIVTRLPEETTLVPLDALLVEQVLVNLVENAVKYTPPSSPIELGAELVDGAVELWVADRGPGVAASDSERIFEKFARGSGDARGAGLGLTICKGIVTAHEGRIWVAPREGGGASFRLSLPIRGQAPALKGEA